LSVTRSYDVSAFAVLGEKRSDNGQGGYWVPRAVAFEKRIASAIADPDVVDISDRAVQELLTRQSMGCESPNAG